MKKPQLHRAVQGLPADLTSLLVDAYQVWTGGLHRALASGPEGGRVTRVNVDPHGAVHVTWE